MRLDKFLSETGLGTRKEVKFLLKKGGVTVNDVVKKDGKFHVNEEVDTICFHGEKLHYQKFHYFLLNKPKGVLSATEDKVQKTVIDLLDEHDFRSDLFPVGRLDKDTVGLLLITNNGMLAHELLSPKKHVEKEYFAKIKGIATLDTAEKFAKGITLENKEATLPAQLIIEKVDETTHTSEIRIILHEGKFHQIKRMFEAVGMKVIFLERVRMGSLLLDEKLERGEYRRLTGEEVERLAL
ncbi:16S rRNA pseudouridine516 synthase [Pilibacter termitis]|uniref:Pseudouridine synthase n=1 Tax=Pilibacter termitis TaxID=263852 RepID=A0A1T4M0K9_9ENTE|nr:pseudouridine synthase [Pilibacter termitis]SJZ60264.1 16S rRNA pseudouridine516 synthase [Pilibacter termitis]